jgi:hypothetical protein
MKNDIRSIAATALLLVGLAKASSKVEGALAPKAAQSNSDRTYPTPCLIAADSDRLYPTPCLVL